MYKGDISNLFADAVVFDINILVKKREKCLLDKIRNLFGFPVYELKDKRAFRYFETLFYNGYTIYLLDRNKFKTVGEKFFDDWCYSKYFRLTDLSDIVDLFEMEYVKYGFVDRDVSATSYHPRKCYNFVNWEYTFAQIRSGL